ncbi:MAG: DNA polymerase V [Thermoproteota archaeon]|jgi:DNA polymerase V
MEILEPKTTNNNNLEKHYVPLYGNQIACGLFGVSDDFVEERLSLDEKFSTDKASVFFVRASGDSMEPLIFTGDILIVDTAIHLFKGAVGAFFYNGNPICKRWIIENGKKILRSDNPSQQDIIISEDDECELFGVVVGMARGFY